MKSRKYTLKQRAKDQQLLAGPLAQFQAYLDRIGADLAAAWQPRGRKSKPLATVAHGLAFATWQSLHSQGLSDPQASRLVGAWIETAGRA